MQFIVMDRLTKTRANRTIYQTRKAASRAVDRLDNAYGAYRYYVATLETEKDE